MEPYAILALYENVGDAVKGLNKEIWNRYMRYTGCEPNHLVVSVLVRDFGRLNAKLKSQLENPFQIWFIAITLDGIVKELEDALSLAREATQEVGESLDYLVRTRVALKYAQETIRSLEGVAPDAARKLLTITKVMELMQKLRGVL